MTDEEIWAVWDEVVGVNTGIDPVPFARAIEAARATAEQSAWQPIETAPKDREIWAFNGEQARMKWSEGADWALWIWADELLSEADPEPDQPTDWQPLPAAPDAAIESQQDAAIESKQAESSEPIPGSPAYSLRGLYVPVDKYFVDGKPVTPDEYIAWQSQRIEAITKSKVPDQKYYGGSAEEGDQHEVKCSYVDGWNECRAAIESEPAEQSLWQPIETAPKTGRTLLLGYPNSLGNWRTVRGEWLTQEYIDQNWEEPDEAEAGWYETSVEADDVPSCWPITPTHWQPLPKPPADAAIESQRSGDAA